MSDIKIGIIGGSGLYQMKGMQVLEEREVETPYGRPSDKVIIGQIGDRKVAFIPRHGRGHTFNPTNVPVRANIWALRSLGVFWTLAVSAVGSLRKEMAPRDFVIPDQIIDRTRHRPDTFFDDLAVHVGFSYPFHPTLRRLLLEACWQQEGLKTHDGGTYVCMEGPLFSTKAESEMHRSWGASLIGMTALPEAKLAREAEMCYAAICLVTDYDVWHEEDHVNVASVMENVKANTEHVQEVLRRVIPLIPIGKEEDCDAFHALRGAVMTRPDLISQDTWTRVGLFLEKYFQRN
ncbi:S-methyl-5'-thioadenosine phosphorylase [Myxococcota bacterium]|nr:S-methyl-5'-thioadenosine phosphorylase [Myxococcota bacterium]